MPSWGPDRCSADCLAAARLHPDCISLPDLPMLMIMSLLQAVAAHVCYLVASSAPQAYEPASRLCLPGEDHRVQARCFATRIAALQRSEVLEWARTSGEVPNRECLPQ